MAKRVLKQNDIVRVMRAGSGNDANHGVKFGALMRIGRVYLDGDAEVVPLSADTRPIREGEGWAQEGQYVDLTHLKYAKQANRFDQRRG